MRTLLRSEYLEQSSAKYSPDIQMSRFTPSLRKDALSDLYHWWPVTVDQCFQKIFSEGVVNNLFLLVASIMEWFRTPDKWAYYNGSSFCPGQFGIWIVDVSDIFRSSSTVYGLSHWIWMLARPIYRSCVKRFPPPQSTAGSTKVPPKVKTFM